MARQGLMLAEACVQAAVQVSPLQATFLDDEIRVEIEQSCVLW
jgi:hypothetical protein